MAYRSPSGQRHYPDEAIDRVRLIQRLFAAGLNSEAICELLPCAHTGVATPAMLERLGRERVRIEHQIEELQETRDRLGKVIDVALGHAETRAPSGNPA